MCKYGHVLYLVFECSEDDRGINAITFIVHQLDLICTLPLLCGSIGSNESHQSWSCAPSPDSSLSDKLFLMLSNHLHFALPPIPTALLSPSPFYTYASSLFNTCSYHFNLLSCSYLPISPTFVVPLILSFLILSSLLTPIINLNILIAANSNIFSCAFFTVLNTIFGNIKVAYKMCSFFVDFQHERNILASEAIPSLRTYCHAKGLDLQAKLLNLYFLRGFAKLKKFQKSKIKLDGALTPPTHPIQTFLEAHH